MIEKQVRDVSEAVLIPMTEEEMANWCRKHGQHVVCHHGRYWKQIRPGFYQPIHWLARLSVEQATRPVQFCWGFRAALCEDEAAAANGSMPVHLLSNVEGYDLQSLPSKRRNHLQKCRRLVKIVELTGPALLQEQGYEVVLSKTTRTGYSKAPSKEAYLASLADYVTPGSRLVIAGLIGDKLGGYLDGYAINGTAYIHSSYIATEALATQIGSGLVFEFMQVCRRCGGIYEVVRGQHSPEDPALCVFKEGMGFPVKHIPTKVSMNPIIGKFIRWRRPYVYYRLTGDNTILRRF